MSDGFTKQASLSLLGALRRPMVDWMDQINGAVADFVQLPNLALGIGNFSTAALTVDIAGVVLIAQTTPAGSFNIPPPTNPVPGRRVIVMNNGSVNVTIQGIVVVATTAQLYLWSGTQWIPVA
jgi:hypothetical protein